MGREKIIEAHNLAIGYGKSGRKEKRVHSGLNFELMPGELVCLLGPNGAGKSTLLRTLAYFQPALAGSLLFEEKELCAYSERERSRKIGVVLTDKTQTGGLTVSELIALGRQPHTGFFGQLKEQDRKIVVEAMTSVGIAHKANNYVAELSDGERQKAMIAKALVQECPLILLDEPTAFLDVVSRIEIMQLLHAIARVQGKTILLSTHDVEQALVFADRLWLLTRGGGLQTGVTEDLVFDGSMDGLFARKEILFDREHGGYAPVIHREKPIAVKAPDLILQHWVMNALARNGFSGLPSIDIADDCPVLTVRSHRDMTFTRDDRSTDIASFGQLVEVLRDR